MRVRINLGKAMHLLPRVTAGVLLVCACSSAPAWARSVVLRNATVIDVTGAPSRARATVVIAGNRIAAIGDADTVEVPSEAEVLDATGKFVIPGLWDMHVHWYLEEFLSLFIANGVTGARIMWGSRVHHAWRTAIERGSLLGPRLVIGSSIIDGPKPVWPGSVTVSRADDARAAVRDAKQAGSDFIKIYDRLSRDAFLAVADEASRQSLRFAGHVPDAVSAAEAARAGQHSIEHLSGILVASSTREDELRPAPESSSTGKPGDIGSRAADARQRSTLLLESFSSTKADALFADFVRYGTWQTPTLTVLRSFAHLDDQDFRRDARLRYLPAEVTAFWEPGTDWRFRSQTAEDFALARRVYRRHLDVVGMMHRAGVDLLAGTDAMNPFCFPGFSLHDELELLVESGLKPLDALRAATLNPARFLGKDQDYGTVEPGKVADLVLLDADPLRAIDNTRRIHAVVVDGRLLDRTALDRLLARAEASAARPPVPPLPENIIVVPPGADVPDEVAAFSGTWVGQWAQSVDHVLVVTKIEGRKVTFIYSVGLAAAQGISPKYWTLHGTVDESGVLQGTLDGASIAYRLSHDRQMLTAEHIRKGSTTYGSLRRR